MRKMTSTWWRNAGRTLGLFLALAIVLPAAAQSPPQVGQWEGPYAWPLVAIHTLVLPSGQVLVFDGPPANGGATAQIWDPASGTFTPVPNTFTNLFGSGHSALADGRLLFAGGTASPGVGLPYANIFDPMMQHWTLAAPMAFARWYPTVTTLPDGRLLVTSGSTTCETCLAPTPETYDPLTDTWTQMTGATLSLPLYPMMFVLPDGRVLAAGSVLQSIVSQVLNLSSQTWTPVGSTAVDGGSAVMYAPGKIMKSGTAAVVGVSSGPAAATTYVIDMTQPSPAWQATAPMAFPRAYHNLTMLPDGSVLATGGGTTTDGTNTTNAVLPAEIWSPVTQTWTTIASMQTPRLAHSTAVLLPDGRVLVSGGGRLGPQPQLSAELLSPPYLFKGTRPTISTIPAAGIYGRTIAIGTPNAAGIGSVALVGLGAATQGFNAGQRYVSLAFTPGAGTLTVQMPANSNLAPPGYYMLFIVDTNGVPSVADTILIGNDTNNNDLPDAWERNFFGSNFGAPGYGPNDDPDGDGLTNAQELALGTNPMSADTDGDGYSDGAEVAAGSDPLNSKSKPGYALGSRINFNYANRTALLAGGWHFLAKTGASTARNTEQATGFVVDYNQTQHPGTIRIPADQGTLWGAGGSSRNTLFRNLPPDWISIRLQVAAFSPNGPYQGACLMAYQDDDNYVVICRDNVGSQVTEWWRESAANAASISSIPDSATTNVKLRIDRNPSTNTLTAYVSDGGAAWSQLPGSVVQTLLKPRIGVLVGGNTVSSTPSADLAYVEIGTVSAPLSGVLGLSPSSLNFIGTVGWPNPAAQTFNVANAENPSAGLNWTATSNQSWLSVSPQSGTSPSTVSASVSTAGLTPGTYNGAITVSSSGATNSPQTIPVVLTVRGLSSHVDLSYASRAALLADGWWDFLARTPGGGIRNTEQTSGFVVDYDQTQHPGAIRIPADQGTLWGAGGSTRNTLFRDLPSDWTTIRLQVAAFGPTAAYQGACLMAYQDDDKYTIVCRDNVGSQVVEWWTETGGTAAVLGSVANSATSNVRLRIDRNPSTNALTGFFSTDGALSWTPLPGSVTQSLANPRLGIVIGGNTVPTTPSADLAFVEIGTVSTPLPPAIGATPSSLTFKATQGGPSPASQTLTISNLELSGTFSWTATTNQPWLTISAGSGTAPSSVTVSVSSVGLSAGTYNGTITLTAPGTVNSPRTVPVVLTMRPPSPSHIDLNYANRTALLADGWWDFLARTASGGTRDTEQTTGLVVSYDQSQHPGVLRIPADQGTLWGPSSNNTRNTLFRDLPSDWTSIRLQVAAFAPSAVYQGACLMAYQDDDNYTILCRDYIGSQAAEWWKETGGTAAPIANALNAATTNVRLRIDRNPSTNTLTAFVSNDGGSTWAQLPGSSVQALANPRLGIVVGGNTVSNTPSADLAFVEIATVSMPLPPALGVDQTSMSFTGSQGGPAPASQTFNVTNAETSGGTLNWTAVSNQSWLTVSPGSGTASNTAPSTVTVTASTGGLTVGTYSGTVTISAAGASGSPKVLPVTVTVTAPVPPSLSVSPTTLSFTGIAGGATPAPRTLSVTNAGGGTINWTASDNQPWLTVAPTSGMAPASISVSVSTTGLTPGSYSGSVTVSAPGVAGSPQTIPVSLTVLSLADSGVLTVAVLVNGTNTTGYNANPASPGEYQRYPERYLEHLQVPYEVIDVSTTSPPAGLAQRHLIIAGHSGLGLSSAWRSAIVSAVNGGTGFVNLDWDPAIGSQSHIQTIFGATGSTVGAPATTIHVKAAVVPGGSSPHYIAGLQRRFLGAPAGDIVYEFHQDDTHTTQPVSTTVLTGGSGTVIATIGNAPLFLAKSFGTGRAVHVGTLDYLRADRFGFLQGVDDLFWRSVVWAAKKPFVVRGYPRYFALQMDDTEPGWASRVQDLYDPTITGTVGADGTGGPWKVTGYVFNLPGMPSGSADRASIISDIKAGKLQVVPHAMNNVSGGDIYWNGLGSALTDSQWVTNLNAVMAWKQGAGGADTVPGFSRAMVPHFWNLSNNTGADMWNTLGFRYVTSIQKPGYKVNPGDPIDINNFAERPSARPFWIYEKPPKLTRNEDQPFFFADDYPVGSRAGLPVQNMFLFATQYHVPDENRPDYAWPNAGNDPSWTVADSVDQFQLHTWRFWSSMAPMQLFTHDASNYEWPNVADRRSVIQQSSTWLASQKGRQVFMENLGDYIYARNKSLLTGALLSAGNVTFTLSGNAATADGVLVQTQLLMFLGDDEGTWRTIPGFTGGGNFTLPVIAP